MLLRPALILSLALLVTSVQAHAHVRAPELTVRGLLHRIDHQFDCAQVKDPDLAIEGCKALIEANPDDGSAHLALALAYERIGDGSEALNAFIAASNVGHRRVEASAADGEAWLLIALASQGAARITKDEPDMRKDFLDDARAAALRAEALGLRVPTID